MEPIAATGSIPRPGPDMFIVTKQTLQAAIRETPEGRVYYPNGRAGHVLDAATERRVARVLTAYFFILVGGSTVCGPIMAQTHLRAVVLVVEVAAVLAFRYAALAYVLRAAPRSTVPFSREDALHRVAATYGTGRIALMVVCVLLVIPATAFVLRDDAPWEQAAMLAIYVAMAAWVCVFAVRVTLARAAMARAAMAREPAHE